MITLMVNNEMTMFRNPIDHTFYMSEDEVNQMNWKGIRIHDQVKDT